MTLHESCAHCCTKIENLAVRLGGQVVLDKVNLHMNCKELLAIIGPNGAGKTTLLRAILGEISYQGMIDFRVRAKPHQKPRIGYVPQKLNFDFDSPISVYDLLALGVSRSPLWLGGLGHLPQMISEALDKVAAKPLMHRRIGELSGGELQRVLLAMALIPLPDLLLLDEPISAVDVKGLSLFYDIVDDLKKKYDISIIMATHDLPGIAPHADRMILLNRSILAEGTPQEVLKNEKLLETFQLELWHISKLLQAGGR